MSEPRRAGRISRAREHCTVAGGAAAIAWATLGTLPSPAFGQEAEPFPERRFAVDMMLTGIDLQRAVGESSAGLGLRVGYSVVRHVAVEGDVAYFPENPAGNYGYWLGFAGVRSGTRFHRTSVFGVLKPGYIHLGGTFFRRYNRGSHTNIAVDVGLAIEFRLARNAALRFDLADTVIPFGDTVFRRVLPEFSTRVGTTHNRHVTLALGLRL